MGEPFEFFEYGAEIPPGMTAMADQADAAIQRAIKWLVVREIMDHLVVDHVCRPGCFATTMAEVIMGQMPPDQVQYLAVNTIQMLAKAFLKDSPGLVDEIKNGEFDGLD